MYDVFSRFLSDLNGRSREVKMQKPYCDGRESNPGQLLGRQLCSPLYHHRCQRSQERIVNAGGPFHVVTFFVTFYRSTDGGESDALVTSSGWSITFSHSFFTR